jgi:DNA mismatch repair protein MutH
VFLQVKAYFLSNFPWGIRQETRPIAAVSIEVILAIHPPVTESELLKRVRALGGKTISEVAQSVGIDVPGNLNRKKGFVGQLCEMALGANASTLPVPDFVELGIELKTLPISKKGAPLESTYVCRLPLEHHLEEKWATSRVRKKLQRVLFMLVEGERDIPLPDRRFGLGFLWGPNTEEDLLLRADWEDLMDLCARGLLDGISARRGQFLQLRPKAANSQIRTMTKDMMDEWYVTKPRGFYLRRSFTTALLNRFLSGQDNTHAN